MTLTLLKSALAILAVIVLCTAVPPQLSLEEEAQYIALDGTEDLTADATLIPKIVKDVTDIRSQFPMLKNIKNAGNWILGSVLIKDFDHKSEGLINSSKFGPIKSLNVSADDKSAVAVFTRPYQPIRLAEALQKEFGVNAQAIWHEFPDFGDIAYDATESTYTFREGLENCGPDCDENRYWVLKVDKKNGTISLEQEYATSIPKNAS